MEDGSFVWSFLLSPSLFLVPQRPSSQQRYFFNVFGDDEIKKKRVVGQWQQPQAEHSGEPLGDPNARVIEVFLLVLDGVQGETLWWGGIPRAQPHT